MINILIWIYFIISTDNFSEKSQTNHDLSDLLGGGGGVTNNANEAKLSGKLKDA